VEVAIIRMTDEAIPDWSDALVVPDGEVGEICVKGRTVTRRYFRLPEATHLAKIADGDAVRHRIGDLGYRDAEGRIWYCGRKSHRVETEAGVLTTVPREAVFNTHPDVRRSALVGVGERPRQRPVIVIEPAGMPRTRRARAALRESILAHGAANPVTAPVRTLLFHPAFPVDIRHNAKIFRERLAPWAARELARSGETA
jgi:acyl-CoA synthetase (AMP-forming)/AMP-acid ligase II